MQTRENYDAASAQLQQAQGAVQQASARLAQTRSAVEAGAARVRKLSSQGCLSCICSNDKALAEAEAHLASLQAQEVAVQVEVSAAQQKVQPAADLAAAWGAKFSNLQVASRVWDGLLVGPGGWVEGGAGLGVPSGCLSCVNDWLVGGSTAVGGVHTGVGPPHSDADVDHLPQTWNICRWCRRLRRHRLRWLRRCLRSRTGSSCRRFLGPPPWSLTCAARQMRWVRLLLLCGCGWVPSVGVSPRTPRPRGEALSPNFSGPGLPDPPSCPVVRSWAARWNRPC